ncbi:MAG: hypothetical protein Q4G51_09115 [Dermatophilus congolensis]|nr:hypothetical protein [Dermatophilus congolensis]
MNRAHTIAFVGASGGAGVSCLLAATALRLAESGLRVACLDRDPCGGGLDVVFGLDHVRGVRWPEVAGARGELDPATLLAELPHDRGIWVLSHGRDSLVVVSPEADATVLAALAGGVDVVLIDAGRPTPVTQAQQRGVAVVGLGGTGPVDLPCVAGADDVVLVVDASPQSLAAASAIAQVASGADTAATWWLAQRVSRSSAHLPETVSAALELPLAAVVAHDSKCAGALLDGVVPGRRGPLAKAAAQIVQALSQQAQQPHQRRQPSHQSRARHVLASRRAA